MEGMIANPKNKEKGVYELALLTRTINLPMSAVGKNISDVLDKTVSTLFEGKCLVEGYIKPNSIKIMNYSSGLVQGDNITFEVVFECRVCYLVEGMLINCTATNITKAGIRGESSDERPSPFIVFIARDHHYMNDYFSEIKENDKFSARIIGQRFELNDKQISVIAEIRNPKKTYKPK